MDRTIEDYREKVREWDRRLRPYTSHHTMHQHILAVSFINDTYEDLLLPQLREEVCIVITETRYSAIKDAKERVHIIYFKTTRHRWFQETARRIETWFAEHYPGVSPWAEEKKV